MPPEEDNIQQFLLFLGGNEKQLIDTNGKVSMIIFRSKQDIFTPSRRILNRLFGFCDPMSIGDYEGGNWRLPGVSAIEGVTMMILIWTLLCRWLRPKSSQTIIEVRGSHSPTGFNIR
jgi:hypothetical protein